MGMDGSGQVLGIGTGTGAPEPLRAGIDGSDFGRFGLRRRLLLAGQRYRFAGFSYMSAVEPSVGDTYNVPWSVACQRENTTTLESSGRVSYSRTPRFDGIKRAVIPVSFSPSSSPFFLFLLFFVLSQTFLASLFPSFS
jgi:hypothetical protein